MLPIAGRRLLQKVNDKRTLSSADEVREEVAVPFGDRVGRGFGPGDSGVDVGVAVADLEEEAHGGFGGGLADGFAEGGAVQDVLVHLIDEVAESVGAAIDDGGFGFWTFGDVVV